MILAAMALLLGGFHFDLAPPSSADPAVVAAAQDVGQANGKGYRVLSAPDCAFRAICTVHPAPLAGMTLLPLTILLAIHRVRFPSSWIGGGRVVVPGLKPPTEFRTPRGV